jgi:ribosome-associated heat shock protein Hsp15
VSSLCPLRLCVETAAASLLVAATSKRRQQVAGIIVSVRLDIWLDVSCLFKTRSDAKRACEGGKVDVNGQAAKPHREIKEGDRLQITHRFGRRQQVVVRAVAEQHMPKAQARLLYEDVTPKPSPEEAELRRMARMAAPFTRRASAGAPDKRERRELRRLKGRS